MRLEKSVPEMDATTTANNSGSAGKPSDTDVMMESTTSDSGLGSSSETSSLNKSNFDHRERRESTSSNPSSDVMMPPSPVSREQVRLEMTFEAFL